MIEFLNDSDADENIKDFIKTKTTFLLVVTGASCVPCHIMVKNLEDTKDIQGIPILTAQVENVLTVCSEENIMAVPTTLFYKNGVVISSHIGAMDYDGIVKNMGINTYEIK